MGPHVASTTVYMPYAVGVDSLPKSFSIGNPDSLSRESAYWAMKYIFNLKRMKHSPMFQDIVIKQKEFESMGQDLVARLDNAVPPLSSTELSIAYNAHISSVVEQWWILADTLM